MRHTRRTAYTLFEVIIALVIAVLLMGALYTAVGLQLQSAQLGRDAANQTTLSRSLLTRFEHDINATVALSDPGRFRSQPQSMGGGAATPMASTTDMTSGTTGMAAEAEGADSTAGGMENNNGLNTPVVMPLGVMGDGASLTLYVSKVPSEVYGARPGDAGQLVSDVRKVTYWIGDGGVGLCRQEVRIATADDALNMNVPTDVENFLLAPEVKSLEIRYFDGSGWVESWDSTTVGDDGITPIGSPRAIEVRLGFALPGSDPGADLKYVRHVVAIPTANGITQAGNMQAQPVEEAGTSP